MRAPRTVDQPACVAPVELSPGLERHDEIDLAIGMSMVWTRYGFHVDDINTEATTRRVRLDHATKPDVAGLARAHPTFSHCEPTTLEQVADLRSGKRKRAV